MVQGELGKHPEECEFLILITILNPSMGEDVALGRAK